LSQRLQNTCSFLQTAIFAPSFFIRKPVHIDQHDIKYVFKESRHERTHSIFDFDDNHAIENIFQAIIFQEENKGDEFQKKDSLGLDRKKELCRQ